MDEKIQLGPRAQVNWMKGSSGGAKASDSGKTKTHTHTCFYALTWCIIIQYRSLMLFIAVHYISHSVPCQNSHGLVAAVLTVTLRCSQLLQPSPPPHPHRTPSMTPGEPWEGKGGIFWTPVRWLLLCFYYYLPCFPQLLGLFVVVAS